LGGDIVEGDFVAKVSQQEMPFVNKPPFDNHFFIFCADELGCLVVLRVLWCGVRVCVCVWVLQCCEIG
jgi:hypothetical protein